MLCSTKAKDAEQWEEKLEGWEKIWVLAMVWLYFFNFLKALGFKVIHS